MKPAVLLALALLLTGCAGSHEETGLQTCFTPTMLLPSPTWKAERPVVELETSLGNMTFALENERAPVTVDNFLKLVDAKFYDATYFHRVIPGFVIQGGDPATRDADPTNDGRGGAAWSIADEFNPTLRHDAAGLLSMANSGPNTGSSQFFVTLAGAPHLDDRHAVFGHLLSGNDTLAKISAVRTDAHDRPLDPPNLTRAVRLEAQPTQEAHAVGVHVVIANKTVQAGRSVTYAVILENKGTTRDGIGLAVRAPAGWTCTVDDVPVVPAGTARVVLATLKPASGSATTPIEFTAVSAWNGTANATTRANATFGSLGADVRMGAKVHADYAGLLPDGRLFDTSMSEVGLDPAQPKFETVAGWQPKPQYMGFDFKVGSGVIEGFTNLALRAKEGETVAARIPWQQAYATSAQDQYAFPLLQRDLVFELRIGSVG